jgi:hydrogenase expression/formation protein HypD
MNESNNEIGEKILIAEHLRNISELAEKIDKNITIMEICGGHTRIIMEYGIREILPKNIRLISGPGCPVCVSSQHDIDCMIELASKGIHVATYGDMMRVPGSRYSLADINSKNGNVHEVYSTTEVLELKKQFDNIVFFGVGFETTAPMTAFLLKNNIAVYSVHKLVPPALLALTAANDIHIDGFIDPGHVSTITGSRIYKEIKIPQAIAGFNPERILRAIRVLLELILEGKDNVINAYPEAVNEEGNKTAQKLLSKYFHVSDSEWRGLGILPMSGLEVTDDKLNAKILYKDIIEAVPMPKKSGCRCGDVLKGLIEPPQCPLYRKVCTPKNPQGACMVSEEGSCAISYHYGK